MKNKVIAFITNTHQKKSNKTHTHKKQHSHSRCNCVRKKKTTEQNRTAWITPTNDEATKKNIIQQKQKITQQWKENKQT